MFRLTKKRARALSLEVWRYLKNNPECVTKSELPTKLYNKISKMKGHCPLCQLYNKIIVGSGRYDEICCVYLCPVKQGIHTCNSEMSNYFCWAHADTKTMRARYAAAIVKLIEAWEV